MRVKYLAQQHQIISTQIFLAIKGKVNYAHNCKNKI